MDTHLLGLRDWIETAGSIGTTPGDTLLSSDQALCLKPPLAMTKDTSHLVGISPSLTLTAPQDSHIPVFLLPSHQGRHPKAFKMQSENQCGPHRRPDLTLRCLGENRQED